MSKSGGCGKKASAKLGNSKMPCKSRGRQPARRCDDSESSMTDSFSSRSYSSSTYGESDTSYNECSTCPSDFNYSHCCLSTSQSSFSSPSEWTRPPKKHEHHSCHGEVKQCTCSPKTPKKCEQPAKKSIKKETDCKSKCAASTSKLKSSSAKGGKLKCGQKESAAKKNSAEKEGGSKSKKRRCSSKRRPGKKVHKKR